MEELATELRALLSEFWIVKEKDPALYYNIKRNQGKIRDFLTKNLGSRLIVHDRFIKLEKIPATTMEGCGISSFETVLDYVLLCIVLLYLEDKTRGDIFVLSNLIEYVKNTAMTMELEHVPDWNLRVDRKSFTRVMDFLADISVIKVKDTESVSFGDNQNAQVLYEATGLANYVMRLFSNEIFSFTKPDDFLKEEWMYQNEEKGDVRRYRVYRNLFYTPVLFSLDAQVSDYDYIKKLRGHMKEEFEQLSYELEVTRNMAFLYEYENSTKKENFPNNKKISEIVLMVNECLYQMILKEEIFLDEFEVGHISKESLEMILKNLRTECSSYFSKHFLELTFSKFQEEVISYMKEYAFIREMDDGYLVLPSVSRFQAKLVKDDKTQLDLFGGEEHV